MKSPTHTIPVEFERFRDHLRFLRGVSCTGLVSRLNIQRHICWILEDNETADWMSCAISVILEDGEFNLEGEKQNEN